MFNACHFAASKSSDSLKSWTCKAMTHGTSVTAQSMLTVFSPVRIVKHDIIGMGYVWCLVPWQLLEHWCTPFRENNTHTHTYYINISKYHLLLYNLRDNGKGKQPPAKKSQRPCIKEPSHRQLGSRATFVQFAMPWSCRLARPLAEVPTACRNSSIQRPQIHTKPIVQLL